MIGRWAAGAALVVAVAGCSGGQQEGGAQQDGGAGLYGAPQETTAGESPTPAPSGADVTLGIETTPLGNVLADGDGMVLYMFEPDEQGASTCYDQCEQVWPPLATEGTPAAGEDVDGALLGAVERDDGSQQVTYNGWPLYYFAQDARPGDVTGQGVNDVWWVLDPAGEPIRE